MLDPYFDSGFSLSGIVGIFPARLQPPESWWFWRQHDYQV